MPKTNWWFDTHVAMETTASPIREAVRIRRPSRSRIVRRMVAAACPRPPGRVGGRGDDDMTAVSPRNERVLHRRPTHLLFHVDRRNNAPPQPPVCGVVSSCPAARRPPMCPRQQALAGVWPLTTLPAHSSSPMPRAPALADRVLLPPSLHSQTRRSSGPVGAHAARAKRTERSLE